MTRNGDLPGGRIKATVSPEICWVPEKDASDGTRVKFVWLIGRGVRIAGTSKHTEMIVGWVTQVKGEGRSKVIKAFGR